MQIQRIVSRTETYTTQETKTGTRSDGAGGTESYSYTESVQRSRVVNDTVTEEVPDPVPPRDQMLAEEAFALDAGDEANDEAMSGEEAIAVLDRDFEVFDTANSGWWSDNRVSTKDLQTVADNADGAFTAEQQEAAQVLLDSPTYRNFVDTGAGNGSVDGTIGRDDVTRAMETIDSGSYLDELLDTAGGQGRRDAFVGNADVQAALSDPSLPQSMKDALQLVLDSTEGGEGLYEVLAELDTAEIEAIGTLAQSPEYAALSDDERQLVADAIRDSGGDPTVTEDIRALIQSPDFASGTAETRTEALSRIALLSSTELADLPTADQDLVRQALADADLAGEAVAADLLGLLQNENFGALGADTKTSLLSQAANYPTSDTVSNLERLTDETWFQNQDLADQQRSAKLVGYLSANPGTGDQATLIENTLDRLLSPTSDYELVWASITSSPGSTTFGHARGTTLTLNEDLVPADNNPLGTGANENHVVRNTVFHEISHLVNGDTVDRSFEYLNDEYRAWYVGHVAETGVPPTNEEAMARWEYFLNPAGGYGAYSNGTAADPGALMIEAEAEQIFEMLSTLSGLEVDDSNYLTVMGDPSSWTTTPTDPAPGTDFNPGDDLDN